MNRAIPEMLAVRGDGGSHGVPLRHRLGYAAYDVAGVAAALAAAPALAVLPFTNAGRGLGERFGRLPAAARALSRPLWVHAASVGEVLAAQPLVEQVRRQLPGLPVLVTTTSVTGRETARARLGADAVMLLPFDVAWIVGRAVRRLQPCGLVIVETELWPGLLRAAARAGIPCAIVSGRISARAAARYRWIGWLMRAALAQVAACAAQSADDAARLVALGAPTDRVQVVGSLKLGRAAAAAATAASSPGGIAALLAAARPLLIAASTHPDEEQFVLAACRELWAAHPDLLLLLAPRRLERTAEVEALVRQHGLTVSRRSALRGTPPADLQVLLLDTLGELPEVLGNARAVFVGGTIAPVGGHNVLEPALCGRPVAFGPHTANVAAAAQALLDAGAATLVCDAAVLQAEWRRLLADGAAADAMGARGRRLGAAGTAVATRTFAMVRECLALAPRASG